MFLVMKNELPEKLVSRFGAVANEFGTKRPENCRRYIIVRSKGMATFLEMLDQSIDRHIPNTLE
jgi:hypothetical protein